MQQAEWTYYYSTDLQANNTLKKNDYIDFISPILPSLPFITIIHDKLPVTSESFGADVEFGCLAVIIE